jgi:hypothetical protein
MSYRPGGSGGGYYPPSGPSNYNVSSVRARRRGGGGVPWLAGCGLLLLGLLIGAFGLLALAIFWFGTPASNQTFERRDTTSPTDLTATLSESYINSALTKYLKDNPINLSGILQVKDVVLELNPNQQVKANLRLGNGLVDFDVIVVEQVGISNNQLQLKPVGQPQVGKGNLPIGADKVVELVNNTLIVPQLNRNFFEVSVGDRKFRLVDVTTASKTITVKYNAV